LAAKIASGQLYGTMIVVTPTGKALTRERNGGSEGVGASAASGADGTGRSSVLPSWTANAAASWQRETKTPSSVFASCRILPFSRDSSGALGSVCSSTGSAVVRTTVRLVSAVALHIGNAPAAAFTAVVPWSSIEAKM